MTTNIRPELSKRSRYYLPRHRYYELKHFCLQYPEWKKRYSSLDSLPMRSPYVSERVDAPKSDPTQLLAEARLYFSERIRMVERTAVNAGDDLGILLLRSVTEGISYEHLSPPCCRDVWYALYRRFFWLLDRERK